MNSDHKESINGVTGSVILVVDDNINNLKLLEGILIDAGYRVRLAKEGELALRSAMAHPPSLVLLDIRMPGMDGYEVCRRLKEDEGTSEVPVIFISILEDEEDKVKGFQAGAADYINKPFQPAEVLARIKHQLRLKELTEKLEQMIHERTEKLILANQQLQQEITERRQAEDEVRDNLYRQKTLLDVYQKMAPTPVREIISFVVDKCVALTGSTLGFVGLMSDDNEYMEAHVWSEMTMENCPLDKPLRFSLAEAGLWAEPVRQKKVIIVNDYREPNPCKKGCPPGHLKLNRFLGIPVIDNGRVAAVAGLANRQEDYKESDQYHISLLLQGMWDIIKRKRAEEEIITLNRELEKRVIDRTQQLEATNRELEAFAYSISHDLRAPLRHINGFVSLLEESAGEVLNEQSRHYMDIIARSAIKMGILIDNLLNFSRMGSQELYFEEVNMEDLIHEVVDEFAPECNERKIIWEIADLPPVEGDRSMLKIVLMNLISNAMKFTRTRDFGVIEVGWQKKEDEVVVSIRDNGVGFDPDYTEKLFGVFQRLHRSDEFEGTGVGLAIAQRIILRHGGRMWAEGEPERGAVFYFSLPLNRERVS